MLELSLAAVSSCIPDVALWLDSFSVLLGIMHVHILEFSLPSLMTEEDGLCWASDPEPSRAGASAVSL